MKKVVLVLMTILLIPVNVEARRGCCSHHGGVYGCNNYGRTICNDGTLSPTCTCSPPRVYGCTDRNAYNYNSNANTDDGSCKYHTYGCTDSNAYNYDSNADSDDGSCKYHVNGCTDENATNYNSEADTDDGNCEYPRTNREEEKKEEKAVDN